MKLPFHQLSALDLSRRTFLAGAAAGMGQAALAALGGQGRPGARAKRVIHLYMAGGPSHLETFDEKPELAKLDGHPMPESYTGGQQLAQVGDVIVFEDPLGTTVAAHIRPLPHTLPTTL